MKTKIDPTQTTVIDVGETKPKQKEQGAEYRLYFCEGWIEEDGPDGKPFLCEVMERCPYEDFSIEGEEPEPECVYCKAVEGCLHQVGCALEFCPFCSCFLCDCACSLKVLLPVDLESLMTPAVRRDRAAKRSGTPLRHKPGCPETAK